ncbi:MAG: PD40 domain-containing protein [Candidatus Aminicenantes bacterium]|nr:PD40 domain-containing protein [Candidatus Aminicenantes bacterium]
MRNRRKTLFPFLLTASCLIFVFGNLTSQESAAEHFEKAFYYEDVQGDLQKAIELYEQILKQFPEAREIAAKAQLHIGLCYEKLGLEEAPKAYQKVVDDFPEQAEVVKIAKEKLSTFVRARAVIKKDDKEFRIRLVGQGSGMDDSGEISPDDKYLSCVDWETSDLAVIEIASGEMLRLTSKKDSTPDSPDSYEAPLSSVWAPDSKQVAYTWYGFHPDTCDLRIVGVDNKKPRILYRGDYYKDWVMPHDWSPDGKYILAGFLSEEGWKLGLISIKDSSIHHLITIQFVDSHAWEAKFSPDGQYLVYNQPQEENSSKSDISLLSKDGTQEIPLIKHPADDRLLGWAPDGKNILFISDRTGTWDAWTMPVSNGNPQGDPKLIRREIGLINPMGISRKGSFYYSTPGFKHDIFYASLDPITGKINDPAKKYPLSYEGHNTHPDLSPDGKYFVYVSGRGQRALCIYSLESGDERELSPKAKFRDFGYPRWIPDGHSILLYGDDIERGKGFYKVDIKTGNTSLIIEAPAWSPVATPDGKAVYYVKETSKEFFQIMKRDIKTGEEKELYRIPPYDNNTLGLSPDGKRLALMMRENEMMRGLKVLPVTGGEPVELCRFEKDHQVKYIGIAWSPDGRYIYFSKQKSNPQNGNWELWRIPSEGGEAQNLKLAMHRFMQPNIHPDGKQITFASWTMHEKVGGVWVMENFLPEIKDKK